MADIELVNPEEFRRELTACGESELIANLILSHGGLHALSFIRRCGPEKLEQMIEQIEGNIGVIEQIAAERGISLEIVHAMLPK